MVLHGPEGQARTRLTHPPDVEPPVVDVAAPSTTLCPAGPAADPTVPCVLMRAGTSRGPFFLREWRPAEDVARDEELIGAIGASDLLQVDGVGRSSTLTSKVAIVS